MATDGDGFDELAHALVATEYDFDAVEQGSLRATWTDHDREVTVVDRETGEEVVYTAEDLVIATSDRERRNARTPNGT